MTDIDKAESATVDRIVRECVEAGMPSRWLGTLRGSLADAWRAALAARKEPPVHHIVREEPFDFQCACGGKWTTHSDLLLHLGGVSRDAQRAAREDTERPSINTDRQDAEFAAWEGWHPIGAAVPNKREAHCHGFDAGIEWAEEHGLTSMVKWFVDQKRAVDTERPDWDPSKPCDCGHRYGCAMPSRPSWA
jgi:hypothetical protein